MAIYQLTDAFVVQADPQRTWAFFSDATNLPRITPSWLAFQVLTPEPIHLQQDSLIDYRIKWKGLAMKWRTRIIDWSPPHQFIDLQLKGPYALWHHQHQFEPSNEGTICRDRVIYKLPLGPLGAIGQALSVRRQLLEIFRYRREIITRELGWVKAIQPDVEIKRL